MIALKSSKAKLSMSDRLLVVPPMTPAVQKDQTRPFGLLSSILQESGVRHGSGSKYTRYDNKHKQCSMHLQGGCQVPPVKYPADHDSHPSHSIRQKLQCLTHLLQIDNNVYRAAEANHCSAVEHSR